LTEAKLADCRRYRKKHRVQINKRQKAARNNPTYLQQVRDYRKANPHVARGIRQRLAAKRYILITQLKDRPCKDCRMKFPLCAMDFDHVRGRKQMSISQYQSFSLKKLLREIPKCDVICSNCHRIRTAKRGNHRGSAV